MAGGKIATGLFRFLDGGFLKPRQDSKEAGLKLLQLA
jgi:predicted enzyme related to lactoylglutathione lyase